MEIFHPKMKITFSLFQTCIILLFYLTKMFGTIFVTRQFWATIDYRSKKALRKNCYGSGFQHYSYSVFNIIKNIHRFGT